MNHMSYKGFSKIDREVLQDAGKITAEIAKAKAETEFEKYRVIQFNYAESLQNQNSKISCAAAALNVR